MHDRSSPLTFLRFSYLSAILTILLLVTLGQIIIQVTLGSEVETRAYATTLHYQALQSQYLWRNSILLLDPKGHVQAGANIAKALPLWEQSQAMPQIAPKDYAQIDQALHTLLILEGKTYKNERARVLVEVPSISIVFNAAVPYLTAVNSVFVTTNVQADQQVALVRLIEIALFSLTLMTIGAEFLLVIRPAHRQFIAYNEELQKFKHLALTLPSPLPSSQP